MKFIEGLPSKTAFWLGAVGGMLTVLAVGFLVTLPMVLAGTGGSGGNDTVIAAKATPSPGKVAGAANTPAPGGLPAAGEVTPVTSSDHVLGDINKAKVFLIEYSDMECPYCQRFHATMHEAMKTFGTDVAWVYRHFPLSFHANAEKEAEASECAAELGGNQVFWKYIDAIYERTKTGGTGFALDQLAPLAKELGLNEAKFKTCLDSGKYAQKVQDMMSGGEAGSITGTPGTILLTRSGESGVISGAQPLEQLKASVNQYLK